MTGQHRHQHCIDDGVIFIKRLVNFLRKLTGKILFIASERVDIPPFKMLKQPNGMNRAKCSTDSGTS
jgi:hypothetical protein